MRRQTFLLRGAGFVVGLYLADSAFAGPTGFVLPKGTYWYAVDGEVPQQLVSDGSLRLTIPRGRAVWVAKVAE